MCSLIRKLFLPITLSVLCLFVLSVQNATEISEHVDLSSNSDKYLNSSAIENTYVRLASSGSPGNSSTPNTAGPQSMVLARPDLYEIISHARLAAGQFTDVLIRHLLNWSGKPSEEALDDDLTLIVADYQHV